MATLDLDNVPEGPAGVQQLRDYLFQNTAMDAETVKNKEKAVTLLTDLLVKQQDAQGLTDLLTQLRSFFNAIPKAKTAKIVRSIIDSIAKVPGSSKLQVGISRSCTRVCALGAESHVSARR